MFSIIKLFYAAFIHTDFGVTCSDNGFIDLSNDQECLDAVNYAKSFNREANYIKEVSREFDPKGCFIYETGNMFFNLHSTGRNNVYTRSICKTGNK